VSTVEERSYVETARREKRVALEGLGVQPFAYRYDRTHTAQQALQEYGDAMGDEGPLVAIAGRIASIRSQGKTVFAHLEDSSGRIQIYLRKDVLGDPAWEMVQLLDLDDHIGVRGHLFRTKKGEVTVRAGQGTESVTLLAKSLRPLPRGKSQQTDEGVVTYGGLQDTELRYRQRYADLAVNPDVREVFYLRSRLVRFVRRFLDERGFLEAETPILQPLYGGAAARPFVTHHHALDMPLYLRIADELYLKRLLVGGLERVYEIGHDFRNEGMDRTHNPEFTMLEFYQAYADYEDMMSLTESLISGAVLDTLSTGVVEQEGVTLNFTPPFPRVGFIEGVRQRSGLDLRTASDSDMRGVLLRAGGDPEVLGGLTGGKLQDEVFKTLLEPHLVQPTFVVDYPKPLSPLAKQHRSDPALTERFELFVAGKELANGFSELNDPDDQRSRFEEQVRQRAAGDEEAHSYDADYIRALEYGMPPAGGVGVGIDRLMMTIANRPSIRDVIFFPAMRPEGS
jgi:lysyl-tRNA synthetase, class II